MQVTQEQWGRDLISSWNKHSWVTLQQRIGGKIASFIGAEADEVVATDSTSLNVFKTVSAALDLRPDRSVIISGTLSLADRSSSSASDIVTVSALELNRG